MATLSFQTLLSWESIDDFQEQFVLSRFDSGGQKAVAYLCPDKLVIQKVLYNEKIAKIDLPCIPYIADLIACEREIECQIDEVFEVQSALRSDALDAGDAAQIIRSKCQIIPIGECSVGVQASIYFSAGGARPSVTIRSLRKSATSGKMYFGREGRRKEAGDEASLSSCLSVRPSVSLSIYLPIHPPSFIRILLGINLSPGEMVQLQKFLKSPAGAVQYTALLADKAVALEIAAGNSSALVARDNAVTK